MSNSDIQTRDQQPGMSRRVYSRQLAPVLLPWVRWRSLVCQLQLRKEPR
jgi:hypothetical protein